MVLPALQRPWLREEEKRTSLYLHDRIKAHSTPTDKWWFAYFVGEKRGSESFVQGQVAVLSKSQNLV